MSESATLEFLEFGALFNDIIVTESNSNKNKTVIISGSYKSVSGEVSNEKIFNFILQHDDKIKGCFNKVLNTKNIDKVVDFKSTLEYDEKDFDALVNHIISDVNHKNVNIKEMESDMVFDVDYMKSKLKSYNILLNKITKETSKEKDQEKVTCYNILIKMIKNAIRCINHVLSII